MFDNSDRPFRLVSFFEDQPKEDLGSLIPKSARVNERARRSKAIAKTVSRGVVSLAALFLLTLVGVSGYGYLSASTQIASPTVTIVDPLTFNKVSLGYGPQVSLAQASFFTQTRDAFIEEAQTFIEIDLSADMLRYFENGVLAISTPILDKGEEGSWWKAPSGLYKIEKKDEYAFSTMAQVYFPASLIFEGNYMIHGWPAYPDDSPVKEDFIGGGIRIDSKVAESLYEQVSVGIPVLVHQLPEEPDTFVYEPTVEGVSAPHYLIVDVSNGSILAASDLEVIVPIASLTKLMTAVVTAEKMDLDSRVRVASPTFVTSLIPRLAERTSVSMYSLLQLLLIESSNEAAEVIAGEYGRDEFIKEMNTKARQLGLLQSTFTDPSGLNAGNVSSLGDLYRLTRYIYDNRDFIFEITTGGEVHSGQAVGEFDSLVNFNEVPNLDNFVGGKIGETTAAGQTSISLHHVNIQGENRTVAIILLGSTGRAQDVQTLMRFVESRFIR